MVRNADRKEIIIISEGTMFMALGQFRETVQNGIKCYKDNGWQYFTIRCLEKVGFSDDFIYKIKLFYNPYLDQNIYIPVEEFDNEFEPWEKEMQKVCRIAVQCHIFYTDLLVELLEKLNNIPYAYDLYLTTDTDEKAEYIRNNLNIDTKANYMEIQVLPNKGRDVIPFLQQMRPVFNKYDYLCHLHTKKTLHNSKLGDLWRKLSYNTLLGSVGQVRQILAMFHKDPKIGLLFPHIPKHTEFRKLILDWAYEKPWALILWERMKFKSPLPNMIIFPAGNMLWLRTKAVKQLLNLPIVSHEIPIEDGQKSCTIMHAIERLWVYIARENSYDFLQIEGKCKSDI